MRSENIKNLLPYNLRKSKDRDKILAYFHKKRSMKKLLRYTILGVGIAGSLFYFLDLTLDFNFTNDLGYFILFAPCFGIFYHMNRQARNYPTEKQIAEIYL
jgi:hypothetical protein